MFKKTLVSAILLMTLAGFGGHAATHKLSNRERIESFCGSLFDELKAVREHVAFPAPVTITVTARERRASLKRGAEQTVSLLDGVPHRIDALELPSSYRTRRAKFIKAVDVAAHAFSRLAGEVETRFSGTTTAGLIEEAHYASLERPAIVSCVALAR